MILDAASTTGGLGEVLLRRLWSALSSPVSNKFLGAPGFQLAKVF